MVERVSVLVSERLNRKRTRSLSRADDACRNRTEEMIRRVTDHYPSHQHLEDGHSFSDHKRRRWSVTMSFPYFSASNWVISHAQGLNVSSTTLKRKTRRLDGSTSFKTLLGLEREMLTEQMRVFDWNLIRPDPGPLAWPVRLIKPMETISTLPYPDKNTVHTHI
jgi:hypothetical protein